MPTISSVWNIFREQTVFIFCLLLIFFSVVFFFGYVCCCCICPICAYCLVICIKRSLPPNWTHIHTSSNRRASRMPHSILRPRLNICKYNFLGIIFHTFILIFPFCYLLFSNIAPPFASIVSVFSSLSVWWCIVCMTFVRDFFCLARHVCRLFEMSLEWHEHSKMLFMSEVHRHRQQTTIR